ncbi:MAG: MarR family transcriptional regulator [Ktedonobacteraceae bacterium]
MNIDPNNNLGYWLFYAQRCVAYAFADVLQAACVEHGKLYVVTPPQWGVLALLCGSDTMTVGTISQRRGVDAPTITGIIKRLEQNGLVERHNDREDRRVVKVYITSEGKDIIRILNPVVQQFNNVFLRGLSEAERQIFLENLQRIIANITDVFEGAGDRFRLLPGNLDFE